MTDDTCAIEISQIRSDGKSAIKEPLTDQKLASDADADVEMSVVGQVSRVNQVVTTEPEPKSDRCACVPYFIVVFYLMFLVTGSLLLGLFWRNYPDPSLYNQACGYGQLDGDTCVCFEYYTKLHNGTICNYQEKSWGVALIFQIFFGYTGASFFYLQRYSIAALYLIFFTLVLLGYCRVGCSAYNPDDEDENRGKARLVTALTIMLVAIAGAWVYNIVEFALNNYVDSNGVALT